MKKNGDDFSFNKSNSIAMDEFLKLFELATFLLLYKDNKHVKSRCDRFKYLRVDEKTLNNWNTMVHQRNIEEKRNQTRALTFKIFDSWWYIFEKNTRILSSADIYEGSIYIIIYFIHSWKSIVSLSSINKKRKHADSNYKSCDKWFNHDNCKSCLMVSMGVMGQSTPYESIYMEIWWHWV